MLLTIQVSDAFRVPSVFLSDTEAQREAREEALLLGAFVQQHVQTQRSSEDIRALRAKADADLAALKTAKDAAMAALQQEVAAAEAALATKQQELITAVKLARQGERERTMLEMTGELEKAKQRYEAAEERRRVLETERATDIAAAESRTRALLQETLAVREEQVRAGQVALKALEDSFRAHVEELRSLNEFVRRKPTAAAKEKGTAYEDEFRALLERAFGIADGFSISNTAKSGIGHAGDIIMKLGPHETLWEVKNYDRPVPKAEVEKFRRDVLENPGVRIGVMVSKITDITGKTSKGFRDIEFADGRLLIYVSGMSRIEDPVDFLQSLLPLFQIWWETQRDDETAEVFQESVKELERLLGDLTRRRTEWRVHRARLEETLRWTSDLVEDAETRVESLVRMMRAGTDANKDMDIPEGIFRSVHTDERVRETIRILLETCSIVPTSEVRLNDLADVLKARKSLTQSTARQHVMAALQDSVVISSQGKPTMVRGLCVKEV